MKVAHISYADGLGGAFRAAYRVHSALGTTELISRMFVVLKLGSDPSVHELKGAILPTFLSARRFLARTIFQKAERYPATMRSLASSGAGLLKKAEAAGFDVINLHWIGNETVDLREFTQVKTPLVWRVADMWPFCGAEHYANDNALARWRIGYDKTPKTDDLKFDIDRYVWERKRKFITNRIHFVATSSYVAKCLADSALFAGQPITIIPNALDISVFRPMNKAAARDILGLPQDKQIIMFGAQGGTQDPRKGWDLLEQALNKVGPEVLQGSVCAIFGEDQPDKTTTLPMPIHWLGRLNDDITIALAYSAADVMVVPSRQETFGQTASEAIACGAPVVAFRTGGLTDIVTHEETGWLAEPYDPLLLARGIEWVLSDQARQQQLSANARQSAVERFAYPVVAAQYTNVYQQAIEQRPI